MIVHVSRKVIPIPNKGKRITHNHLSDKVKGEIRQEFVRQGGKRGFMTAMGKKYGVPRGTISRIVNNGGTLHKHTVDRAKAQSNLNVINRQIDSAGERFKLINHAETEIEHLVLKLKDKKILTDDESIRLHRAIQSIENVLKGHDSMNKQNIHYHIDKIVVTLENLTDEQEKILAPQLKKLICDECPLYKGRKGKVIDI